MTPHRLNDILHQVYSASQSEIELLEKLTKEFPYYNLPFIILAKIYKQKENYTYETSRTRASIRATNRVWLYDYLHENSTEINGNDDQGLELISAFVNETPSQDNTEIAPHAKTKTNSDQADSLAVLDSSPTTFPTIEDTSKLNTNEKTAPQEASSNAENIKKDTEIDRIETFEALVDSFNEKFSGQNEEEDSNEETPTTSETQPENSNEQLHELLKEDSKPIEIIENREETTELVEVSKEPSPPSPSVKNSFNDWLNKLGNKNSHEEIKPKNIDIQQIDSKIDSTLITETFEELTEKLKSISPPKKTELIPSEQEEETVTQQKLQSKNIDIAASPSTALEEKKQEIYPIVIEVEIEHSEITAELSAEEENKLKSESENIEPKTENIDIAEIQSIKVEKDSEIEPPKEETQEIITDTNTEGKQNSTLEKEVNISENQELVSTNKSKVKQEEKKEKVIETLGVIDSFLNKNPTITRPKAEFFKAEVAARKSLELDNEIVTETLAKIYERQGYYTQAIQAYEKLSLKFPHKSTYFADLIKVIKTKNEN